MEDLIAHALNVATLKSARYADIRIVDCREQVVTVTGGSGESGGSSLEACRGRSPHGFLGQEAEVAAGIARFIRGASY